MNKKTIQNPDWWLCQCKCGKLLTDYPFFSCSKCGMIHCGSKEQLEQAKKEGNLILDVEVGIGKPNIEELRDKYGDFEVTDQPMGILNNLLEGE